MAAEDELRLPEVPEAKPEDPEDVSWALSTAEAMWARGDHLEGIKWVRKAAEAASDAEDDMRALELAKAASDLTTLISRRSMASAPDAPAPEARAAEAPRPQPQPVVPPSNPPVTRPSGAPPKPHSSRPIPLPSKASQPPPKPAAAPAGRAAPRPLAAAARPAQQGPQPGKGILSNRTATPDPAANAKKSRRRSRDNLEGEARAAGVLDTAPQTAVDGTAAARALGESPDPTPHATTQTTTLEMQAVPMAGPSTSRTRQKSFPESDGTLVASREDLQRRSAAEWDASPTQNLSGEEMSHMDHADDGDRKTAFAVPAAPVAPQAPSVRPPSATVHDPEIQTSQAVRVVVWRDGNGVHIAPAGTVVSAISIDAVLVVLEPSADLTAWLSQRDR